MRELGLGLQIIPTMSSSELVETVVAAEALGYDHCMVADEGLLQDPYVALGAAAGATDSIRLGVVTNGYTRHPAATAAAIATLDELSEGRAFVVLVAGGTMVLDPMGIERSSPLTVVDESIEIMRALWNGDSHSFAGRRFSLSEACLGHGRRAIPLWVAGRGERMLELAGRKADAVVLMAKADLGDAISIVERADREIDFVYLDRLALSPEMIEEARHHYAYAILDSPARLLHNLGIDDATIATMHAAFAQDGAAGIAPIVTDDMLRAYQIAGSPEQCRAQLHELVARHGLDAFALNVISPGLESNRRLLAQVADLVRSAP